MTTEMEDPKPTVRETDMSHEDNSWGTKLPVLSVGCVIGIVIIGCLALVWHVIRMVFIF